MMLFYCSSLINKQNLPYSFCSRPFQSNQILYEMCQIITQTNHSIHQTESIVRVPITQFGWRYDDKDGTILYFMTHLNF